MPYDHRTSGANRADDDSRLCKLHQCIEANTRAHQYAKCSTLSLAAVVDATVVTIIIIAIVIVVVMVWPVFVFFIVVVSVAMSVAARIALTQNDLIVDLS